MAELTSQEVEQITRLFGYVPEPEPLEEMLAAVTKIKADALTVVAKIAAERDCADREKHELEERYKAEIADLRKQLQETDEALRWHNG